MCNSIATYENHDLSREKLANCRQSIQSLKSICKKFTANNLRGIEENLANSWMVLFQQRFNELEEKDLTEAIANFELIFKEKKVRTIFIINLLPYCEELLRNKITKGILFLKKACQYLSEDSLGPIGRKISLSWFKLIEAHAKRLEYKDMSAVVAIHKEFSILPEEIQEKMTVTGLDEQKQSFPLILLLTYRVFHERIFLKQLRLFPQTSTLVLQAFESYLYKKRLPRAPMSAELYVQLLDIARGIQDNKLVELCLQKLGFKNSYLRQASIDAVNGDNASIDKKRHYLAAVSLRPSDKISCNALGNIAFEEKKYGEAALYFDITLESNPNFSEGLKLCQALMECLKALEGGAKMYLRDLLDLIKKFIIEENFQTAFETFLKKTGPFIEENALDLSEPFNTLSKGVTTISQLIVFEECFQEAVESAANSLLNRSKIALKNIPVKTSEYYLLEGEISYERGELPNAFHALSKVKEREVDDLRFWNLSAKLDWAQGNIDSAKSYLKLALKKDPVHPDLLQTLILMGDLAGDIIPPDTQNKELCLTLGFSWYQREDFEKAKDYYFKADFYDPRGCFILGKILELENYYFKRALQIDVNGDLEPSYCLEIFKYFLQEGKEKDWEEMIPCFLAFKQEVMEKVQELDFPQKEKLLKIAVNKILEEMEYSGIENEIGMDAAYLPDKVPERLLEADQLIKNKQWEGAEKILQELKSYYPFETDIDLKWGKLDLKKKEYKSAIGRFSMIKTQDSSEEFIQLYSKAMKAEYDNDKDQLEAKMNQNKNFMTKLDKELLSLVDTEFPVKISPRALKKDEMRLSTLFREVSESLLEAVKK